MRSKTVLHAYLALSLVSPVERVSAGPTGVSGENWTLLMSPGQCGPGYSNPPPQGLPSPYWSHRIAVDRDGRTSLTNLSMGQACVISSNGQVSLFAGGNGLVGQPGLGDGGLALNASIYPDGIAVDGEGNVLMTDRASNRIRRVDATGIISSIAGGGGFGNEGVGGPATLAQLGATLRGIFVDPSSQIYFVEAEGPRVLRIDNQGILTHIAGKWVCLGMGGDGGPALEAELAWPSDVAATSTGIVFIADEANGRIRRVDESGMITTLYGDGNLGNEGCMGFENPGGGVEPLSPRGIALDSRGALIIADGPGGLNPNNVPAVSRLLIIYPSGDKCVIPVSDPTDVAVDSEGRIIYATAFGEIWRIEDPDAECGFDNPVDWKWGVLEELLDLPDTL